MILLLLIAFLFGDSCVTPATWYNKGTITYTGAQFNKKDITCACHDKTKIGHFCLLSFKDKQVIAYCNDYSPKVFLDLSEETFRRLAPLDQGNITLHVLWSP